MVSLAFNGSVQNTYKGRGQKQSSVGIPLELKRNLSQYKIPPHLVEIALAKFVLCPSGLGMDTYRFWETLLLGSIPVVESNKGFDRTYSMLPVLVVPNFDVLTPELLNEVYPCFIKNAHRFRYDFLLEKYWLDLVDKAILEGTIEHVTRNHPPVNPFCSFF
jgi:hypothetical protein